MVTRRYKREAVPEHVWVSQNDTLRAFIIACFFLHSVSNDRSLDGRPSPGPSDADRAGEFSFGRLELGGPISSRFSAISCPVWCGCFKLLIKTTLLARMLRGSGRRFHLGRQQAGGSLTSANWLTASLTLSGSCASLRVFQKRCNSAPLRHRHSPHDNPTPTLSLNDPN